MNAKQAFYRMYGFARRAMVNPSYDLVNAEEMARMMGASHPEQVQAVQAGLELAKDMARIREEFPILRERMHYLISCRESGEYMKFHPLTWVGDAR